MLEGAPGGGHHPEPLLCYSHLMPNRSSKTPDINEVAARIAQTVANQPHKDPLAVELGRRGGLKGGKARARRLSAARRKQIARRAAKVRWSRPVK